MVNTLIERVLAGEEATNVVEEYATADVPVDPQLLLVSYKDDVDKLHKALLQKKMRPKFRYANTSARTQFYFPHDNGSNLIVAYKVAREMGIKCKLI